MSAVFLFNIFMKIDQLVQYVINTIVLRYLHLHDNWVLPALVTVSMMVTVGVVGILIYYAIRWLGWRSLVVFILEPRIWIILLLYTESVRLFWKTEAWKLTRTDPRSMRLPSISR